MEEAAAAVFENPGDESNTSSADIDAFLKGRGCHSAFGTDAEANCDEAVLAAGNKRKQSLGEICRVDGCKKYKATKCEGYCMRCYKSHQVMTTKIGSKHCQRNSGRIEEKSQ